MDSVKWYIEGVAMPQPSTFKLNLEDLDDDSYRSVTTGNLIDNKLSGDWTKAQFEYDALTASEVRTLLAYLKKNPINARIENPLYSSGFVEAQFRCSKKSLEKLRTNSTLYKLSFNLVQKNKIAGM